MSTRLFGTDGVRGVAGQYPLDPPTIARLGAAIVRVLKLDRPARLVVGRDTRQSGEWIERELARGAAAQGATVTSAGIIPTPGVAYLAGELDFDLGVVLSASHNPHEFNGIKVFSGHGKKFGEAQEQAVEAVMTDTSWSVAYVRDPEVTRTDLVGQYIDHVVALLPDAGRLRGSRVALDLANGATTTTAREVFTRAGFDVLTIGDAPDGSNINLACGSTHTAGLVGAVVANRCRLGVAFDGDGDRAIFVDGRGHVVDGDAVLLVLATYYQDRRRLPSDTVVATVMSNLGLELALKERGIKLVRTQVGDKYVMDEMREHGYVLGGEQSGHIILSEHLWTGDGMATALAVLRAMVESGQELSDLASRLTTYPQTLVNVHVREKRPVEQVPDIAAAIARVEAAHGGRGRVLVRYSGTEPLLRIMIEGEDQASVQAWAEEIAEAVRATLS
jgi:phosphoglucosamine mutase